MNAIRRPRAEPAPDYGPRIRITRGDVEVHDAPDAGEGGNPNRTVRRASVVPPYARLWRGGGMTDAMREACDRYAMTCEAETGARQWDAGMPRSPSRQGHPTMTQVQAAASLRNAHAVVGLHGTALLRLYVRDGLDLAEIAKRRHECPKVVKGMTLAAITRLTEHWRME